MLLLLLEPSCVSSTHLFIGGPGGRLLLSGRQHIHCLPPPPDLRSRRRSQNLRILYHSPSYLLVSHSVSSSYSLKQTEAPQSSSQDCTSLGPWLASVHKSSFQSSWRVNGLGFSWQLLMFFSERKKNVICVLYSFISSSLQSPFTSS